MKCTLIRFLSFTITTMLSIPIFAQLQGQDIIIGKSYSIASEHLNEERPYLVYVPNDYSDEGNPHPVLYLLDGSGHFHHTTGIVSYLKDLGIIPNFMVVAIPNTNDRTRDLTPEIEDDKKLLEQMPTAGGAPEMLAFLKEELIPHIDKRYNTAPYKLLTGHSLGGLFAVYSLFEEPELFDAYISISPSMWWDDQNLAKKTKSFLQENPEVECFFYMTMANEGGDMLKGAQKTSKLFKQYEDEKFQSEFVLMENETHGSIPHRSTYDGLEAIFKDFFLIDYLKVFEEGGMLKVKAHFEKISAKLGYSILPPENAINSLGYAMMNQGKLDQAIEIFEENIKHYPQAFNVYDSGGEAYMLKGDKEKAIAYYKKSIHLNPGNTNGINMLSKLGITYNPYDFAFELDEEGQNRFIGKYNVSSGGVLSIKSKEGELFATHPAIPNQKMLYFGNNIFVLMPNNIPIKFSLDKQNMALSFDAQYSNNIHIHGRGVKQE